MSRKARVLRAYAVASGAYDLAMAVGVEKVKDSGYQGLNAFPVPNDGTQRTLTAAAMFSLIGFFILSAAYRAFRVRSIEASILMATALVLSAILVVMLTMLSLMLMMVQMVVAWAVLKFLFLTLPGWIRR